MKKLALTLVVITTLMSISCRNKFQKEYSGVYDGAFGDLGGNFLEYNTLTIKKSIDVNTFRFAFEDDKFSTATMKNEYEFRFIQQTVVINSKEYVANAEGYFESGTVYVTINSENKYFYFYGHL